MKKIMIAIACVAIVLGASKAMAQNIKEGQWSMTMNIQMAGGMAEEMAKAHQEMENMPAEEKAMMQQMMGSMGMQMGGNSMTVSNKQCITNQNPVPKQKDEEGCKETHTLSGNTVKFEMTCKDSHSVGEVTYDNDSMKGTIQSTQHQDGKEEKATVDISGQYEGPCKK